MPLKKFQGPRTTANGSEPPKKKNSRQAKHLP
jgi:hypothetical protein